MGEVFAGFRDNLGQLILGHLVPALITGLLAIPGAIMMAIPIVIMTQNETPNAGLIAIAAVGFLVLLVPLIYLSVCWAFTIPLIMDRRLDFWSAMKASRRQTGRHWWTVCGLIVVMGLLNLAGLLLCCVGALVTVPLTFGTLMLAYEILFTPRAAQSGAGA